MVIHDPLLTPTAQQRVCNLALKLIIVADSRLLRSHRQALSNLYNARYQDCAAKKIVTVQKITSSPHLQLNQCYFPHFKNKHEMSHKILFVHDKVVND